VLFKVARCQSQASKWASLQILDVNGKGPILGVYILGILYVKYVSIIEINNRLPPSPVTRISEFVYAIQRNVSAHNVQRRADFSRKNFDILCIIIMSIMHPEKDKTLQVPKDKGL
jgi:hypothetical protein